MKVYDLNDLIQMYETDTLPQGEKVFKYKASYGVERWIHIDEIKVQANFKMYYPKERFIEGFRGIVNTQHANKPADDNTNNS